MKKYLELLRVRHYIKNLLIFTTLIFGGETFTSKFYLVLIGFISFSLMSSVVYIINDIFDYDIDKKTKIKQNKPIASDQIHKKKAIIIAIILFVLALIMNLFTLQLKSYFFLLLYFVLNLFYSSIGKKIAYLELVLMVLFYLIRIYYGASILNVAVSITLNLTIIFGSLYLTLIKRQREKKNNKYRKVFEIYTDQGMKIASIISFVLMLICYLIWIYQQQVPYLSLTTILIVLIFIRYHHLTKSSISGNPIDIIMVDYLLMFLCYSYIILMIFLIRILA